MSQITIYLTDAEAEDLATALQADGGATLRLVTLRAEPNRFYKRAAEAVGEDALRKLRAAGLSVVDTREFSHFLRRFGA